MYPAMPKDAVITLRIDPEDKKALESTARRRGLTLTSFITRTMMAEAERSPAQERPRRGKVPSFFKTACAEVERGGAGGYALPGRILLLHALRALDDEPLEELAEIVFDEDAARALVWCEAHVPKCLEIVPGRRRQQFAEGLLSAYQDLEDEQDEELLERARELGFLDDEGTQR